jgi:hypothetical protein
MEEEEQKNCCTRKMGARNVESHFKNGEKK